MGTTKARNRAVFLDRDGVLIEDVDLLTCVDNIRPLEGVAGALRRLHEAAYRLVVISNQPVVARGLISEETVVALQEEVERQLSIAGAPPLNGFYFCPHHPNATVPAYRIACECRKPRSGLLLRAAKEKDIDLTESFMIGDRVSDIVAGAKAGCRTIHVQTGRHQESFIESPDTIDPSIQPDHICADLQLAARWILNYS